MLRAALAEDPVAAAGLQEPGRHPLPERPLRRGRRGVRARRQARPRSGRRSVLQARQHRLQEAGSRPGPRELEPGDRRSIRAMSSRGPTSRCWTWRRDARRRRGLRRARPGRSPGRPGFALDAYKDKCLRRRIAVRMRACGVHSFADYQSLLDRQPGRVRAAEGRAHHQRHPVLPKRGDLEPAAAPDCCRSSASGRRGCARLERRLLVGRRAVYARHAHGRPLRAAGRRDRARAAHHRRDRHRPGSLERAQAAATGREALAEMPGDLAAARTSRPTGDERRVVERVRRRVQVRRARPEQRAAAPARLPAHPLPQRRDLLRPGHAGAAVPAFADALAPGGYLVLGKVETLFGPARERLDPASIRASASTGGRHERPRGHRQGRRPADAGPATTRWSRWGSAAASPSCCTTPRRRSADWRTSSCRRPR